MKLRDSLKENGIDKSVACEVVEKIISSAADMGFFIGGESLIDFLLSGSTTGEEVQKFIQENGNNCTSFVVSAIMDTDYEASE